jgi:putative membrane protein
MHDGFGMGIGGGFMWLFWIVLLVVIVWLLKGVFSGRDSSGKMGKSALEILEERYARGEIDREEFDHKKKDLSR